MKCSKCKKEVKETFTNDKWKQVCKECLEKEIYRRRKKYKGVKKNERKYKDYSRNFND